eukprot:130492_1
MGICGSSSKKRKLCSVESVRDPELSTRNLVRNSDGNLMAPELRPVPKLSLREDRINPMFMEEAGEIQRASIRSGPLAPPESFRPAPVTHRPSRSVEVPSPILTQLVSDGSHLGSHDECGRSLSWSMSEAFGPPAYASRSTRKQKSVKRKRRQKDAKLASQSFLVDFQSTLDAQDESTTVTSASITKGDYWQDSSVSNQDDMDRARRDLNQRRLKDQVYRTLDSGVFSVGSGLSRELISFDRKSR